MSYMTPYTAFSTLCEEFNTPRSLAAHLLLQSNEWDQFLGLSVRPLDYLQNDTVTFRNDYFVSEYLSKYEGHDTQIDTQQVALNGFIAGEEQCKAANIRIRKFLSPEEGSSNHLWPLITKARDLIRDAIGEKPDMELFAHYCKWGSGSTYSIRGYEVRVDNKVREDKISITRRAIRYFRYAMCQDLAYMQARRIPAEGPCSLLGREFNIVHGGKGMTVPKNAKTDRFICNEPSGNIFLQLGVGKLIRLALKRVGIDLDDQSINQDLARLAIELGLATVDLKAASDTICAALVWLLLPEKWARLLDDLRSPFIEVDGKWHEAEKFSAMGNGFTFELESLIFWALTTALRDTKNSEITVRDRGDLGKGRVSVYGDDIICPATLVPLLKDVFEFVGFTFNEKKTHSIGGFRESCGKHYFWAEDVTPVYQKESISPIEPQKPPTLIPATEMQEKHSSTNKHNELDENAIEHQRLWDEQKVAYRRFRNRLLYHSVDRAGVVDSGIAYADPAFRKLMKLFGPQSGPLIPLVEIGHRSLDNGDVVCSREVKLKWHGWSYSCKSLKFQATDEHGHVGALYSVYMRSRARNLVDVSTYLNPQIRRRLPLKYLARAYALHADDNLPLPFDETVTLRDSGIWSSGRMYFENPLVLSWFKP